MRFKIGQISLLIIMMTSFAAASFAQTIDDAKLLQGEWQAHSMNAGGKESSAEAIKNMQFSFKENKLTIRGNFGDSRTMEFDYKIDQTRSPKHLDILFPEQNGSILAVYELKEGVLKVCINNTDGSMARPQSLENGSSSNLKIITFKRQNAETPSAVAGLSAQTSSINETLSQQTTKVTQAGTSSAKPYLQMSDAEKNQYIQDKANKVAKMGGDSSGDSITPLAAERIKGFLDTYAKRINVKPLSGCRFGDNLQATYERASRNTPIITKAFKARGLDPQIGIYLAMIESEHCSCLQSPTGQLGLFQFSYPTAKAHFDPDSNLIKGAAASNPDDRCQLEPTANAAASYMKLLIGRYGNNPSSLPLALGSYNSGEAGLNANLTKALETNEALPGDFWAVIASSDKLSKQFQSENFKYIPKFYAAAIIGENPRDFGLTLEPLSTL